MSRRRERRRGVCAARPRLSRPFGRKRALSSLKLDLEDTYGDLATFISYFRWNGACVCTHGALQISRHSRNTQFCCEFALLGARCLASDEHLCLYYAFGHGRSVASARRARARIVAIRCQRFLRRLAAGEVIAPDRPKSTSIPSN